MKIREIQEKDNPFVAKIIRENLEKHQLNLPGTAYFDPELDQLFQFYHSRTHANYWVLVNEADEIVGGVVIAPFQEHLAELQKLYLVEGVKGAGYGHKLLEYALLYAEQHYQGVYLETSSILAKANQLYLRNQFISLEQPLGATGHTLMDTWFLRLF